MDMSPEVLTNSWLSVPLDIPNEREAIVNISLMKGWRVLPRILFYCLESLETGAIVYV